MIYSLDSKISFFLLAIFFLVHPQLSNLEASPIAQELSKEDFQIFHKDHQHPIKIEQDSKYVLDTIRSIFGENYAYEEEEDYYGNPQYVYEDITLSWDRISHDITKIFVSSEEFRTNRGVGIGSNLTEVKEQYGEPAHVQAMSPTSRFWVYSHYEKPFVEAAFYYNYGITFKFEGNLVTQFVIFIAGD